MSSWTHINGAIIVRPAGRSQPEIEYVLRTVLDHLPMVTGSEGPMHVYVQKCEGFNSSSSHDEFGQPSNLGSGHFKTQREYIIAVDGRLRDREFSRTYREFQRWLCRLAKRVRVEDVLVRVSGYDRSAVIDDPGERYHSMYELPSWCNGSKEPAWYEFMLWDRSLSSDLPLLLQYKYYTEPKDDEEAERRLSYTKQ